MAEQSPTGIPFGSRENRGPNTEDLVWNGSKVLSYYIRHIHLYATAMAGTKINAEEIDGRMQETPDAIPALEEVIFKSVAFYPTRCFT